MLYHGTDERGWLFIQCRGFRINFPPSMPDRETEFKATLERLANV